MLKKNLQIIISLTILAVFGVLINAQYAKVKDKPFVFAEKDLSQKAKAITLNHLIPDFSDLMRFVEQGEPIGSDQSREYLKYYEKFAEIAPDSFESYGMVGFFYYREGSLEKAIQVYQVSIEKNPYYFWSYYDLGLIAYKEKNFKLAIQLFKRALEINPQSTMRIIASSRIYQQIFQGRENVEVLLKNSLQQGYKDAAQLLAASLEKEKRGAFDRERLNQLSLKIF